MVTTGDAPLLVRAGPRSAGTQPVLDLAKEGAAEHTVIVADLEGANGVGPFQATDGMTWMTILWRPDIPVTSAALLTLAAGSAVSQAVHVHTGLDAGIQWPTDIVVANDRVARTQVDCIVEDGRITAAAIDIGIHTNSLPGTDPSEGGPVTTLADRRGRPLDEAAFQNDVRKAMHHARALVDEPVKLISAFRKRWVQEGQNVEGLGGIAARVDPDGVLVVAGEDGLRKVDQPGDARVSVVR